MNLPCPRCTAVQLGSNRLGDSTRSAGVTVLALAGCGPGSPMPLTPRADASPRPILPRNAADSGSSRSASRAMTRIRLSSRQRSCPAHGPGDSWSECFPFGGSAGTRMSRRGDTAVGPAIPLSDPDLADRPGRQAVEHLDRAPVALRQGSGPGRGVHDVAAVGRVGQADSVSGLVDGDGEERGLWQRRAVLGVQSQRDRGAPRLGRADPR